MEYLKLFENLEYKYVNDKIDKDRFKIKSFLDGVEIGMIVIIRSMGGYYQFEDEMTEDEYDEYFPDDSFYTIEHLEVYDKFKGNRYAKYMMIECLNFLKKEKYSNIVYLNASSMGYTGMGDKSLFKFYHSFGFKTIIQYERNEEMILKL